MWFSKTFVVLSALAVLYCLTTAIYCLLNSLIAHFIINLGATMVTGIGFLIGLECLEYDKWRANISAAEEKTTQQ